MATLFGGIGDDEFEYGYDGSDVIEDAGGSADRLILSTRDLDGTRHWGDNYYDGDDLVFVSRQSAADTLTIKDALGDGRIEILTFRPSDGAFADFTLRISSADDGLTGSDILYVGTQDDDLIVMSGGYNETTTAAGDDEIRMGDGGGWANAGDGDDSLLGGAGRDTMYGDGFSGGTGNDIFDGMGGDDQIYGGSGNDTITDGSGNDIVDGGMGDDILHNSGGTDTFYGGAGVDTLVTDVSSGFDPRSFVVGFDAAAGTHGRVDSVVGQDTIADIENFTMIGDFNVEASGNAAANILITDDGDDKLNGKGGADWLIGKGGNDTIGGQSGSDDLYGGSGRDDIEGGRGQDLIYGGSGADTLNGNKSADRVFGNGGNDKLIGDTGFDQLYGGAASDRLYGGDSGDSLYGGNGKDFLIGEAGADKHWGGRGADRFVFERESDTGTASNARDIIKDFNRGQDDRIDLRPMDAKQGRSGNQQFEFIGRDGFSETRGELRISDRGDDIVVLGDRDGDGRADFSILVENVSGLNSGDFFL